MPRHRNRRRLAESNRKLRRMEITPRQGGRAILARREVPVSLHPRRLELEEKLLEYWGTGDNPPVQFVAKKLGIDRSAQGHRSGSRGQSMPREFASIDWSRVAEPQADGYDTDVTLHLAMTTTSDTRQSPYERRPVGGGPTIFDGEVSVRYVVSDCPYDTPIINGPVDHPNIHRAEDLVRRWPTVYRQFQRLIDSFHPLWDATIPLDDDVAPLVSCSCTTRPSLGRSWPRCSIL